MRSRHGQPDIQSFQGAAGMHCDTHDMTSCTLAEWGAPCTESNLSRYALLSMGDGSLMCTISTSEQSSKATRIARRPAAGLEKTGSAVVSVSSDDDTRRQQLAGTGRLIKPLMSHRCGQIL